MKKLLALSALLAVAAFMLTFAVLSASCQPKPGTNGGLGNPGLISCGTQAVTDHATEAMPAVNACLSGTSDIVTCLLGLVRPAVGIGVDVIGCLTRHEGAAASAVSQANPADTVDARRAARAREFLQTMSRRGYVFSE